MHFDSKNYFDLDGKQSWLNHDRRLKEIQICLNSESTFFYYLKGR